MLALVLTFVAGLLTVLSPCVLPALPIVVGSAGSTHRAGPLALAFGLVVSFVVVGVLLAAAGTALPFDGESVRAIGAAGFVAAGLFLVSSRLQDKLALWLAPLSTWAARGTGALPASAGLVEQFGVGALLGLVWSPCTGPTLGAAVGLAAQGGMARAALLMLSYGIGAVLPLLVAAYSARRFGRRLGILRSCGARAKVAFGAVAIIVGVAVLTGLDKTLESSLVQRLPQGWVDLLARY